jgi:hypothetical protein
MFRTHRILLAGLAALAIAPATSALAAEVTVQPGFKYPKVVYTAAPGEKNNINLQKAEVLSPVCCDGVVFHMWDSELVFVDLGSPIVRSRDLRCVNSAFSAACVTDAVDSVELFLGDGDDRADVSGLGALAWQVDRVFCGPGFDTVVLGALDEAAADCEWVRRVT